MGRELPFDLFDKVHARIMGRTEDIDENGKEQWLRDPQTGALEVKKKDIVLAEFDGVVDGIAVNYDDAGPYVDYSIAYTKDGKKGPETHYKWVRERELTKI